MKPLLMHKSKIGQNGFTLIELMITFAIIAILATIAIPAYSEYVKQGKASQATSTLSEMRIRFEQYFQDNRTYVGVNCVAPPDVGDAFAYDCSVTPTATSYTIRAQGQTADMANFLYTIDQNNAKTSNYDGTGLVNCWIMKKGGSC